MPTPLPEPPPQPTTVGRWITFTLASVITAASTIGYFALPEAAPLWWRIVLSTAPLIMAAVAFGVVDSLLHDRHDQHH